MGNRVISGDPCDLKNWGVGYPAGSVPGETPQNHGDSQEGMLDSYITSIMNGIGACMGLCNGVRMSSLKLFDTIDAYPESKDGIQGATVPPKGVVARLGCLKTMVEDLKERLVAIDEHLKKVV